LHDLGVRGRGRITGQSAIKKVYFLGEAILIALVAPTDQLLALPAML
jgi:hypothetical protein